MNSIETSNVRTMMELPLITDELLELLRCPQTSSHLMLLDRATVDELNAQIASRQLHNQVGEVLDRPLCGALVNEDRSLVYPIYDHGPTLIVDEAIRFAEARLK